MHKNSKIFAQFNLTCNLTWLTIEFSPGSGSGRFGETRRNNSEKLRLIGFFVSSPWSFMTVTPELHNSSSKTPSLPPAHPHSTKRNWLTCGWWGFSRQIHRPSRNGSEHLEEIKIIHRPLVVFFFSSSIGRRVSHVFFLARLSFVHFSLF
jgi:hypothetical protein